MISYEFLMFKGFTFSRSSFSRSEPFKGVTEDFSFKRMHVFRSVDVALLALGDLGHVEVAKICFNNFSVCIVVN